VPDSGRGIDTAPYYRSYSDGAATSGPKKGGISPDPEAGLLGRDGASWTRGPRCRSDGNWNMKRLPGRSGRSASRGQITQTSTNVHKRVSTGQIARPRFDKNPEAVDSHARIVGLEAAYQRLRASVRHTDAFSNSARLVRVSCLECVFRLQRRTRASGEPPGARTATSGELSGCVILAGLPSRIRSYRKAQRLRLFVLDHGRFAASGAGILPVRCRQEQAVAVPSRRPPVGPIPGAHFTAPR
jgi:hypothetical protein